MARPLRVEYPGAYYHVTNKSVDSKILFPSPNYYDDFLVALADACSRFNVEVHAYQLLRNEYHLLLKTPEGNLSRFMRQVNGLYTQSYNARKKSQGSVFHSRYKAIVVQAKPYLLEVTKYIHNLSASGSKKAIDSAWSSMPFYANKAKAPSWLVREDVLALLKLKSKAGTYAKYLKFVDAAPNPEISRFYSRKNLHSILGGEKFKVSIKAKASPLGPRGNSKDKYAKLRPSIKKVVSGVAKFYKIDEKDIYNSLRGPSSKNIPRWVAMHLCQELSGVTLQDIATRFGLKHYGTVSTVVGKLRKELLVNSKIQKNVKTLTKRLSP